jgi:hypothetical protein
MRRLSANQDYLGEFTIQVVDQLVGGVVDRPDRPSLPFAAPSRVATKFILRVGRSGKA